MVLLVTGLLQDDDKFLALNVKKLKQALKYSWFVLQKRGLKHESPATSDSEDENEKSSPQSTMASI